MLKKAVFVVTVMSLVAGCGGFDADAVTPGVETQLAHLSGMDRVHVFIDPETGCEYLIMDGAPRGGITPRLDENGKQICNKKGVK